MYNTFPWFRLCPRFWYLVQDQVLLILSARRALHPFSAVHVHGTFPAQTSTIRHWGPCFHASPPLIQPLLIRQVRPLCFIFKYLGIKSNLKTRRRAFQVSPWFDHFYRCRLLSCHPTPSRPLHPTPTGWCVPTQYACFCFRTFAVALPSAQNALILDVPMPWAFLLPQSMAATVNSDSALGLPILIVLLFSIYL